MTETRIRDRNNKLVGILDTKSNGDVVAFTPSRKKLGMYCAQSDKTLDPSNRLISRGNTVVALLYR